MEDSNKIIPTNSGEIVLYQPNADVQLEVKLQSETIWLSQQQIAMLFGVQKAAISKHMKNIFASGELVHNQVVSKMETTATDGKNYQVDYYNLDMILSVGYRVNSHNATQFRRWANQVLKDHLLRGYSINHQLVAMQERIDTRFMALEQQVADNTRQIDFFVRTNLPPVEHVFYDGDFFEARLLLERLIKSAQQRAIIIDTYVDASTFELLDVRKKGVTATIYHSKSLTKLQTLHNATPGTEPIEVIVWRHPTHDRWLIIDDRLYHCGPSVKDAGAKIGTIALMGYSPDELLERLMNR